MAGGGPSGVGGGPQSQQQPQFHLFVAAMQLIGKGPDAEALYVRITSAVKAAMIRVELPARLPMGRRKSITGSSGIGEEGGQVRGFHAEYLLGDDITSGAFATVYKGTHRHTGRKCAIKVIAREKLTIAEEAAVLSEVLLHAVASDHPNVVDLIDFFEEQHNFYLVMELMGGDLFNHVKRPMFGPGSKDEHGKGGGRKRSKKMDKHDDFRPTHQHHQRGYAELDARDMVRSVLLAVRHCHRRNIAHCDLKPKNVMLVTEGDETRAKLADFGLSSRTTGPNSLTRLCGSPLYVAPEVINRTPYDVSSDMWSVGALTYLLLSGTTPFTGSNLKEIFPKIQAGKYEFSSDAWDAVSDEAKEFVRGLLTMNPADRPTAHEALGCPWMKMDAKELAVRDKRRANEGLRTFDRALPVSRAAGPKTPDRAERKRFGSSVKGSMHNSSGSSGFGSPRMKKHHSSPRHSSSHVTVKAQT
uniref:Protein kinase domain-containing protein n=1 Tax=Odontella aurita TaxID=265563 RepID=A0A6U6GVP2_9STRA